MQDVQPLQKIIEDGAKNDLRRSPNPAAEKLDTANVNTEQLHQFRDAVGVNLRQCKSNCDFVFFSYIQTGQLMDCSNNIFQP